MAQYTGHSTKHGGLQNHSVGDFYPIITVYYGDDTYGLMLGGLELRGNTRERNNELRDTLHTTYVLQGWEKMVGYFKRVGATEINFRGR